MSFLCNNATAFFVAAVASVVVWLFGGTRGDLLLSVAPWLIIMMIEVIICFPQRHSTETTYDARSRAWKDLKRDPVVWMSLVLLALLIVPFLNNGLCVNCDAKLIAQGLDPKPPVPALPFCVDRLDHLNVVFWFALALLSVVAVRHGMTRQGKRLVLELIVWNGVAVAMFGFVEAAIGAPGPFWQQAIVGPGWKSNEYFATFGYTNMAGDYFTTLFALAIALWRDNFAFRRLEDKELAKEGDIKRLTTRFWRYHYFMIPAVIFFFAAMNTLSRSAIILVTVSAVVFFVHTLVSLIYPMRKAKRITVGAWSILAFAVVMFFASTFMPKNIRREVDSLGSTVMLDRVTGREQYHPRIATALWRDHLLFGCGGWGYAHFCNQKMTPAERKNLQTVGGVNVHNDYLQFLAEHGLVGFGLLTLIVVALLWPICRDWRRLVKDTRFKKGKDLPAKPVQIFALPAPAFVILFGASCTLIHAFGDCPLRSPAILIVFFIMLAAIPGFMPKMTENA